MTEKPHKEITDEELEEVNGGVKIWDAFMCAASGGHRWNLVKQEYRNGKRYRTWKCAKCQTTKEVYD